MTTTVNAVGASVRQPESDEIDLGKLIGHLLDGWRSIVAITALFTFVGAAYALLATPVYQADTLIQVEPKSKGIPGFSEVSEMFASDSDAVTEIELIKSRMVLGQVVDALELTTVAQPNRMPLLGNYLARRNADTQPSQWMGYALGGEAIEVELLDVPSSLVGKPLFLYALPGDMFKVTYDEKLLLTGQVGQLAEASDLRLMVTRLQAEPGTVFSVTKRTRNAVIEEVRSNLAVSERGKGSGILSLSYKGADVQEIKAILDHIANYYLLQNVKRMSAQASNSLDFLDNSLPAVKAELEQAESAFNRFQSQMRTVDMSLETEAILKQVVEYEKRLNDLNIKETEVQQLYTRSHPIYQALVKQRDTLTKQRDELTGLIEGLPDIQQELLRLRRDVEVAQTIYVELLNRAQELKIVKASTVGTVRIIDPAEVKPLPVAPRKSLIVVLAAMLGGMVGFLAVLMQALINRGVETPDELEGVGLSVYATVPKSDSEGQLEQKQRNLPLAQRLDGGHALLALANPADLSVEALRSLRTSLHFAMLEAKNNILMVSGPAPGVGKSFISANLASVMAQSGQKVLLIDGDMRRGYMQRIFGAKWDNGLSDYLAGKVDRQLAIRSTVIEGLDFIPRGQIPPNPAELLMLASFKELMEWASENYDLVIIDTPPILAVTDPAIVGSIAGTSIMVVKHQVSPLKEIEYSVQRFATSGIHIKGVILNQQVKSRASAYDYGYYQYDYKSAK